MNAIDQFIHADEQFVVRLGQALGEKGVSPARIELLLEYGNLSLMPRDNDDADDFSPCDWRLYSRMEQVREMFDRKTIRFVEELLEEWVSQMSRHYTINSRLDEFIVRPKGPLVPSGTEDDPLWRKATLSPEQASGVLDHKQ